MPAMLSEVIRRFSPRQAAAVVAAVSSQRPLAASDGSKPAASPTVASLAAATAGGSSPASSPYQGGIKPQSMAQRLKARPPLGHEQEQEDAQASDAFWNPGLLFLLPVFLAVPTLVSSDLFSVAL